MSEYQNTETTGFSRDQAWIMLILSIPLTIWAVTFLIRAHELWQYASGAIFLLLAGTLATYGIKTIKQSKKSSQPI